MASVNQGGSILSFLLIGGVLTVLLVGGAYAVQQRATQPGASPVATQPNDTSDKAPAPAAQDKKVAVEPNKDAQKQEATKQEEAKKAEQQKATAKQEAEKKEAAKPLTPGQVATPPATQLPQTGPTENISAILGLGLLSGVSVAYMRSRNRRATL